MSKGFWAIIAAVVLVFIGIITFSGDKSSTSNSGKKGSALSQHVQGAGTSGVTLLEYGDYECPYCQQYYPTVKEAVAKFGDKIKFQFRNFPLTNIHKNAFAASRAAEAAAMQDKFWEMHDALYESSNYQAWTTAANPIPAFEQIATSLGLNKAKFKTDYASSAVNDAINADMAEGNKLGISGTPTFFINGKKTDIANDATAFETILNDAISAKASATTKN